MKGCPKCGRTVPADANTCPYCDYQFARIEQVYKKAAQKEVKKIDKYSGMIKRLVAINFDMLLMILVFIGILLLFNVNIGKNTELIDILFPGIITLIIYFFYSTILEGSSLQGTFGQKLAKIKVTDDAGYELGFSLSLKRNLAKILNVLTLGIGYIALVFTKKKQSLADYVSDTYVENSILEYNTKLVYANVFLRLIAFIIDIVVFYLIYLVINFGVDYIFNHYTIDLNKDLFIKVFFTLIVIVGLIYMDTNKGTFGKQLMGYKVADLNGNSIGVVKAFFRLIMLTFEVLLLPVGIIYCLATPTKQTFKDLITHTVVIKNL